MRGFLSLDVLVALAVVLIGIAMIVNLANERFESANELSAVSEGKGIAEYIARAIDRTVSSGEGSKVYLELPDKYGTYSQLNIHRNTQYEVFIVGKYDQAGVINLDIDGDGSSDSMSVVVKVCRPNCSNPNWYKFLKAPILAEYVEVDNSVDPRNDPNSDGLEENIAISFVTSQDEIDGKKRIGVRITTNRDDVHVN